MTSNQSSRGAGVLLLEVRETASVHDSEGARTQNMSEAIEGAQNSVVMSGVTARTPRDLAAATSAA